LTRFLGQLLFVLLLFWISGTTAKAAEWSGYLAAEGRAFPSEPAFPGQTSHSASFAAQPEFYQSWEAGGSLLVVPFFRLDSADSERTHFDLREFFYLHVFDDFELSAGIRKIFWGTTESQHLVDIINQTDLVEFPDGEEKLGQPMINLSIPAGWGTLDFFLLPYFRERSFPGRRARLRSSPAVDTDLVAFEHAAKKHHLDLALRYARTLDDLDLGLSHFRGTARAPTFLPGKTAEGRPVLIPLYEQIQQTGLDLAWVQEAWLWKLEAIHRSGQGPAFFAATSGFEYTLYGILETQSDLGLIAEWLYDERGNQATTPFQNDLMVGARLALNDTNSTELLFGGIKDLESKGLMLTLEGSRRIGESWKLEIEGFFFGQTQAAALLKSFEKDDFFQLSLAYYF